MWWLVGLCATAAGPEPTETTSTRAGPVDPELERQAMEAAQEEGTSALSGEVQKLTLPALELLRRQLAGDLVEPEFPEVVGERLRIVEARMAELQAEGSPADLAAAADALAQEREEQAAFEAHCADPKVLGARAKKGQLSRDEVACAEARAASGSSPHKWLLWFHRRAHGADEPLPD